MQPGREVRESKRISYDRDPRFTRIGESVLVPGMEEMGMKIAFVWWRWIVSIWNVAGDRSEDNQFVFARKAGSFSDGTYSTS
jgi:hypothetical protein